MIKGASQAALCRENSPLGTVLHAMMTLVIVDMKVKVVGHWAVGMLGQQW